MKQSSSSRTYLGGSASNSPFKWQRAAKTGAEVKGAISRWPTGNTTRLSTFIVAPLSVALKRFMPHKAMQAGLQQHCRAVPNPLLNPPCLLLTHRLLKPIPGLPSKIKSLWHPKLTLLLLLSKLLLDSFMGGVNPTVKFCFDGHGWGIVALQPVLNEVGEEETHLIAQALLLELLMAACVAFLAPGRLLNLASGWHRRGRGSAGSLPWGRALLSALPLQKMLGGGK
ncbi:MAG: hypothetical protein FRX49_12962 [Trebouxia sp. A1-2]|nr:MAG: hypothetical protein FRX49_12962 [Trebouxia sp. A1-2]